MMMHCPGGWVALRPRGRQQRPAVVALLKTIFAQDTAEAAHAQWKQVADTLRERFPKLAELMDGSREDVLVYMAFPREHWAQIASTNPLRAAQPRDQAPRRRGGHLPE